MAMSYNSLTASKGNSGAIATWSNFTLLDIPVIVDEAQALLWSEGMLRTREMLSDAVFTMPIGAASIALSSLVNPGYTFLDPIGRIRTTSFNSWIRHKDPGFLQLSRIYTETSGTLGANPFTTVSGSNTVTVVLTAHGFTQDSPFNASGATVFNGVTINGTFPITSIVDANTFTIDITILGTTPSGSGSGGGSAVAYLVDSLTLGTPYYFGIYNEQIKFDQAFFQATGCRLAFYQSPPLLSSTNPTNFITTRYPNLMRVACMAAAADFMKDSEEYQKQFGRLQTMIEKISVENDMSMRGIEVEADTP